MRTGGAANHGSDPSGALQVRKIKIDQSKTEYASRIAFCSIDSPVRMAECRKNPETYFLALQLA